MITKFGIWEIDEEYGIIGRVNPGYDYNIAAMRLWEAIEYRGHLVGSWLIHLSEKTWIKPENFNDLVAALAFAQDFFKDQKPGNALNASTAQSIFIAQQLVELNRKPEKNDIKDEDGVGFGLGIIKESDLRDRALEHMQNLAKIKFLEII